MKKILALLLAVLLAAGLAACAAPAPAQQGTPAQPGAQPADAGDPFPGRIAIVTNTIDQNEEEFRSAEALVQRYGVDRIIHRTWPVYFATEPEMMITLLSEIASDLDVGAIIINQAVVNTNAAIDAVREIRGDDIFIAVVASAEDPRDTYARVDLSLDINNPAVGALFVEQAVAVQLIIVK